MLAFGYQAGVLGFAIEEMGSRLASGERLVFGLVFAAINIFGWRLFKSRYRTQHPIYCWILLVVLLWVEVLLVVSGLTQL